METISYTECLKEMFALGRFGIKLEIDTIADILNRLGSPEKRFHSIHIAGTNGKGSIASYIASILRCSGLRVGLYTSPHLIKFNERFCINGDMVSDEDIVESYVAVKQADVGDRRATFFEISTAMAFYLFARENVEWAVIETGMGGRLDATNVLRPAVTVISNLSIEHTEYLGETLEQIAAEKGGIIKFNTPLVTGVTQESALTVLNKIADQRSAPVYQYDKDFSTTLVSELQEEPLNVSASEKRLCPQHMGTKFTYKGLNVIWSNMETRLQGPHQIQNSALALAACELLMERNICGLTNRCRLTEESIRKGLSATTWPGRLEYILQKPLVVIDGAHNLDAAENLGRYLKEKYIVRYHGTTENNSPDKDHTINDKTDFETIGCRHTDLPIQLHIKENSHPYKLTMIIGILNDKPYKEMLTHLLPSATRVIFTKAQIDRSLDPKILRDFAVTVVSTETMIIEDVDKAVEHAINTASESECICIAGSLYVAGEARDKILTDFLKDSALQS
ncbi:MAG: bifunctional folylpolyglutamate synthase/dihydrofolate synthase [Desulfamplus sp.]|nr:bifunctional folylpolyglutamate synthase/dihydrofolate synthase [Desulfamplus sp.]